MEAAAAGKLASWQHGYDALALIILGDQFTRYICSGLPIACSNLSSSSFWTLVICPACSCIP